jgi:glycosyltransferase involved in cell wall biosynthesis
MSLNPQSLLFFIDFIPRLRRTFESWLIHSAAALWERNVIFHVCISGPPVDWFEREFHEAGGKLHLRSVMRGRIDGKTARSLVREIKPTAIAFCFYPMLSLDALRLTKMPGVRGTVFIDQSSTPIPCRYGWRQLLIQLRGMIGGRCYDSIVTVSDYNRRKLVERLGLPVRRLHRIYNGIDLSRFAGDHGPLEATAPILYVGQMEEFKGVGTLIRAYTLLSQEGWNGPGLQLAGGGTMLEGLRLDAESGSLAANVEILGPRNDAPDLMRNSRCIVIPSEWEEACAFVAIEAMASGRPVVCSDAGSLPELFDGKAIVVPKGDVRSLANALQLVCSEAGEEGRISNAEALRERAFTEFSLTTMTQAYLPHFLGACGISSD